MNRTLLTLAFVSLVATGCGRAALTAHTATPSTPKSVVAASEEDAKEEKVAEDDAQKSDVEEAPQRKIGDYVIYRFSGSYRETPIVMSERVIDRQGSRVVMAVVLDEGGVKQELRLTIDESKAAQGDVISVARVEGGVETPMSVDEYEALLANTSLAADENEAELGAEDVLLDIDGSKLPCRKTSYKVRIGKSSATMATLESKVFPWENLGGEITTDSGKVLYRAEVVEAGHGEPGKSVAQVSKDETAR